MRPRQPELIDTHCHLQFDNYDQDREEVLKGALASGVSRIICVGCSLDDSERASRFAHKHENVWFAAGSHPHNSENFNHDTLANSRLQELLTSPKAMAVGEIGLDYYRNISPKNEQIKSLRAQIEGTAKYNLPYIFHVRDAWKDFWEIYGCYKGLKGVVHSFSTDRRQLDKALEHGLYVGLNGIMTFTSDDKQLEAAKAVPLERLVLETDAPFLTPKPHRGTRCEPKHTLDIAKFLAELRGERWIELASATTANAERLFGLSQS